MLWGQQHPWLGAVARLGTLTAQPGSVLLWAGLPPDPALPPQVVYYVFAIVGINLFRGAIVPPPGNIR